MSYTSPVSHIYDRPISKDQKESHPRIRALWRATALFLTLALLGGALSALAIGANALSIYVMPEFDVSDKTFKNAIEELRAQALASCGRRSFNGYCAWYVNLQLYLLDINRDYVAGDGKDQFNNYRGLKQTTGGYRVHAYPEDEYTLKSALNAVIAAAGGQPVRNVLAGFSKAGGDGEKYGHVFFIHLIRDGYVYFSDSFGVTVGGTYYPEGKAIKCTVDELFEFYKPSSFVLDGVIWFEGDDTPAISDPMPIISEPSVGKINADVGLRLRSGPGTGYDKLALMNDGETVWITEISEDGLWGKLYYNGFDGWASLEYITPVSDESLPAVLVDVYESGDHTSRTGHASLSEAYRTATELLAGKDTASFEVRLLLTRAPDSSASLTLPDGMVLDVGSFGTDRLDIVPSGGELVSTLPADTLELDPFIISQNIGGRYYYSSAFTLSVRSASLVIADNAAIRFGASAAWITDTPPEGLEYTLVYTVGSDSELYEASVSSVGENGLYYFVTDGIPAKRMADIVSAYVKVSARVGGKTFERRSASVDYSVTRYAANMYGGGETEERRRLDELLSAMLAYGTAAQKYFDHNTSSLAINALPEEGRTAPEYTEDELYIRAASAPVVNYSSTAHITSASLELRDTVGIRMKATSLAADRTYSLLVWTEEEYQTLTAYLDADTALCEENCATALNSKDGVFVLDGIAAKDLANTFYFRLVEHDTAGNTYYDRVLSYSVTTYCANKASAEGSLAELCRAIAIYSAAARKYFG